MQSSKQPATSAFTAPGNWYRGNLHMHSTESDGSLSPADAIAWYRERGYDFVSLTDHRATTQTGQFSDERFLVIPGIELDCVDPERDIGYHIVGFGVTPFSQPEPTRRGPGQQLVDQIRAHGGLALMAHPYWLGQEGADILAVTGWTGLEVYNATCARPGKAYSMVQWDRILDRGHLIYGFATDDAHRYEDDAGKGWIMVKAPALTAEAILEAIRRGHFYATQGPSILDVRVDEEAVHVHTSPVVEIRCISNRGRGLVVAAEPGAVLTSVTVPRSRISKYLRVECVDAEGRMAWSQPQFLAS